MNDGGGLPWRRLKQIGMGVLGWPPSLFWQSTLADLMAALEGYLERIGARRADAEPTLTRAEFEALKQRFPDRNNSAQSSS